MVVRCLGEHLLVRGDVHHHLVEREHAVVWVLVLGVQRAKLSVALLNVAHVLHRQLLLQPRRFARAKLGAVTSESTSEPALRRQRLLELKSASCERLRCNFARVQSRDREAVRFALLHALHVSLLVAVRHQRLCARRAILLFVLPVPDSGFRNARCARD